MENNLLKTISLVAILSTLSILETQAETAPAEPCPLPGGSWQQTCVVTYQEPNTKGICSFKAQCETNDQTKVYTQYTWAEGSAPTLENIDGQLSNPNGTSSL